MRKGNAREEIDPINEPGMAPLVPWLLVGCGVIIVLSIIATLLAGTIVTDGFPVDTAGVPAVGEVGGGDGAAVTEPSPSSGLPPGRAATSRDEGFVSEQSCAECHSTEFDLWSGSHHEDAMRIANNSTVRGDFGDTLFDYYGMESRFYKQGEKFFVHTEGPGGEMGDFEVAYTFGVEPLQQYLIAFPGGRLQSLNIAWDTEGQRWFHLYPDEQIAPDDPLHWTQRLHTWNTMCAECHSTNLQKNFDVVSDTYSTTWSEINVACQACHGPGEDHVAWARADNPVENETYGLLAGLKGTSFAEVEACARCHSRRHNVSGQDAHGRPLMDDFAVEPLHEGLYHADGQILDEVYVYGSFVQSKMHANGVRCSDCHNAHSLELNLPGNGVCTQCHYSDPLVERFPTLRALDYDSPAHHFHPEGSTGAVCVDCHMPNKTYMVVDPRRDHSMRVPRPDLSIKLGTPNACTQCHEDQTAEWALEQVREWYGPARYEAPHFSEALMAGRTGESSAAYMLRRIAANAEERAIVRATALDLLRRYGEPGKEVTIDALADRDPMVRTMAVGGLDRLEAQERVSTLTPALTDPIRAVRTEAARALSSVPENLFDAAGRAAYDAALAEYIAVQESNLDTPEAHMNMGILHDVKGRSAEAEQSYRHAIAIDVLFMPAHANLATLYNTTGRNTLTIQTLEEAITYIPEDGDLHYSLGLAWAEQGDLNKSAEALAKAAELLPERPRILYNYGLALQQLGQIKQAEAALLQAYRLVPTNGSFIQALAILHMQQGEWDLAQPFAEALVRLFPNEPGPRQMLARIQSELGAF